MIADLTPDFLIIGAQRAGTTSLFHYLTQHPKIRTPKRKEVHFFDLQYEEKNLDWYKTQLFFNLGPGNYITGEASPYYIFHPLVPRRVAKHFSNTKLIILLRNPIDRAYSHYHHEKKENREELSFKKAIAKEEERLSGEKERVLQGQYSYNHQHYSYLARGRYNKQLRRWFKYFNRDQFLILIYEEFFPETDMEKVFDFLNLSRSSIRTRGQYNSLSYPSMNKIIRKKLEKHFQSYNEELSRLLEQDLPWI